MTENSQPQPERKRLRDRLFRRNVGSVGVEGAAKTEQPSQVEQPKDVFEEARAAIDSSNTPVGDIARGLQALLDRDAQLRSTTYKPFRSVNPNTGADEIHERITLIDPQVGYNGGETLVPLGGNPLRANADLRQAKIERLTKQDGSDVIKVTLESIRKGSIQQSGEGVRKWKDELRLSLDPMGLPVIRGGRSELFADSLVPIDIQPLTVDIQQLASLANTVAVASHDARMR